MLTPSDALPSENRHSGMLPKALYTAADVRELDRLAIEQHGIAGIRLMKRAGRATFAALLARWPEPEQITVFCGAGNNAGDGYIIAGLAAQRRLPVQVIQVGDTAKLGADAQSAHQFALREGVTIQPFVESSPPTLTSGLVVDALLGTGLQGSVREPFLQAIEAINQYRLPVLSVDIPSGLCADTGSVLGVAVEAAVTVTFIGVKRGLLTGRGPAFTGELVFDDLEVPQDLYQQLPESSQRLSVNRLTMAPLLEHLCPRPADAHKGLYGHVMLIGGDHGYGGAVGLAAQAAARTGAGLVSVATRPEHVPAIIARCAEVMTVGVNSGQALEPLLQRPTVLVVGPGLGRSAWSEQMLQQALKTNLPLVLDADALNLLSDINPPPRDDWVLTPHPGEAGRFLGHSSAAIQADRFDAIKHLQASYGGVMVLKGAGSLISAGGGEVSLADVGNPGMASGGMGDVLSGVIGGFMAQGLTPVHAAELGVYLHGTAADLAVEESGQRGLLASDLLPFLRKLINA